MTVDSKDEQQQQQEEEEEEEEEEVEVEEQQDEHYDTLSNPLRCPACRERGFCTVEFYVKKNKSIAKCACGYSFDVPDKPSWLVCYICLHPVMTTDSLDTKCTHCGVAYSRRPVGSWQPVLRCPRCNEVVQWYRLEDEDEQREAYGCEKCDCVLSFRSDGCYMKWREITWLVKASHGHYEFWSRCRRCSNHVQVTAPYYYVCPICSDWWNRDDEDEEDDSQDGFAKYLDGVTDVTVECPACHFQFEQYVDGAANNACCPECEWTCEVDAKGHVMKGFPIAATCPECGSQSLEREAGEAQCRSCRHEYEIDEDGKVIHDQSDTLQGEDNDD